MNWKLILNYLFNEFLLFFFGNFISFLYLALLKLMVFVSVWNLFWSLSFWKVHVGHILGTYWPFSHIFLILGSILFLCVFVLVIINFLGMLWNFKLLAVICIILTSFCMALLFIPFVLIFPCYFSFCFWYLMFVLLWLMAMNIIFDLSKNFFINRNWIGMEIQMAFLGLTDPWLFWDHTEVGRFGINKALLFFEIRWFDAGLIGPCE